MKNIKMPGIYWDWDRISSHKEDRVYIFIIDGKREHDGRTYYTSPFEIDYYIPTQDLMILNYYEHPNYMALSYAEKNSSSFKTFPNELKEGIMKTIFEKGFHLDEF